VLTFQTSSTLTSLALNHLNREEVTPAIFQPQLHSYHYLTYPIVWRKYPAVLRSKLKGISLPRIVPIPTNRRARLVLTRLLYMDLSRRGNSSLAERSDNYVASAHILATPLTIEASLARENSEYNTNFELTTLPMEIETTAMLDADLDSTVIASLLDLHKGHAGGLEVMPFTRASDVRSSFLQDNELVQPSAAAINVETAHDLTVEAMATVNSDGSTAVILCKQYTRLLKY
jgi:hypothetical protein